MAIRGSSMRLPAVSRLEHPKDQILLATSHKWTQPILPPRRRIGEALASLKTSLCLIGQSVLILSLGSRNVKMREESKPKSR